MGQLDSFNYSVLDVFTDVLFTGNQLAVIYVNGELEKSQYHNIAREFGYSESSFVYYSQADKALRIRSFTSTGFEIHGAGHNLLGAVSDALLRGKEIFKQQTGSPYVIMKDVPIYLEITNESGTYVIGMKQRSAIIGKTVPTKQLAQGLSIIADDFSEDLKPTIVTTEVSHLMVPLKNVDVLDRVYSDKRVLSSLSQEYGFEGVYCFSFTGRDKVIVESRFFNPFIGIEEDPATGSAAGPLAGFLQNCGYIKLNTNYFLLQGKIMGRPSTIQFKVTSDAILVNGSSVITMEGKIFV